MPPVATTLTPSSSSVKGYRYDPQSKELFVTFKSGGTYRYTDVPAQVAKALRRNKSTGKTLHRLVKKKSYSYEKQAQEGNLIMMPFTAGFADELVKIAKYPISRMLSSPHLSGASGAAAGAAVGPLGILGAASGGLSAARSTQGMRARALKALKARAGMGGRGLMKHERKRLAEATGMSVGQLDAALARLGKKHAKTGDKARLERAATWKYNPFAAAGRIVGARGFAGRAARGKGLQAEEVELIEMLKKEKNAPLKKLLAGVGLGGAVGGVAARSRSGD